MSIQAINEISQWFKANLYAILLSAIIIAGLALRLWGNGFGLPNLYHPDEDALIMPALQIIRSGDLQPTRLEYGSLHIYFLSAVSAAIYVLLARDGRIEAVDQLSIYERNSYPAIYEFPEFFQGGRVVSALFGIATVLLIYMLGRRLGGQRLGLIAAALAAFLPDLVRHSHFATPDTPLVFWIVFALYLIIRAYDGWEQDNLWAFAGAGFVCGLAASTKYSGILLAIPLVLVPILRVRRLDALIRLRVIIGPLAMMAGFTVGTPYAILAVPEFLGWLGYSLRLYNSTTAFAQPSWLYHLDYQLTSPHMPLVILGLFGLIFSFRFWKGRAIILAAFVVINWFAIITQANQQARMWLPTAPITILYCALVVTIIVDWLRRRLENRRGLEAAWLAPISMLVIFILFAIRSDIRFQQDDVRSITQQWVESNVAAGQKIAVDYFSPNLDQSKWPVIKLSRLPNQDLNWYREQGVSYLIMSEATTDPDNLAGIAAERYQSLIESVCLVETLNGPFLSNAGLKAWIYKMPPCES